MKVLLPEPLAGRAEFPAASRSSRTLTASSRSLWPRPHLLLCELSTLGQVLTESEQRPGSRRKDRDDGGRPRAPGDRVFLREHHVQPPRGNCGFRFCRCLAAFRAFPKLLPLSEAALPGRLPKADQDAQGARCDPRGLGTPHPMPAGQGSKARPWLGPVLPLSPPWRSDTLAWVKSGSA